VTLIFVVGVIEFDYQLPLFYFFTQPASITIFFFFEKKDPTLPVSWMIGIDLNHVERKQVVVAAMIKRKC
jgi:hypothetical protein